jgi:hypothetical protein
MAKTKELFYAVIGAGDLAIDKVKGVKKFADRKNNEKLFRDVVKRGRTISTKVRTSTPGKQFKAQTQNVRKQATDAAKNVTKALGVSGVSWPKGRKPASQKTTKSAPRKTTAAKAS